MEITFTKKLLKSTLAFTMILSMTACSSKTETVSDPVEESTAKELDTVDQLIQDGYLMSMSQEDGESKTLRVELISEDYTDYEIAELTLTDEMQEELDAIDFFDEDYNNQVAAFLENHEAKVYCINDWIPDQAKLDGYAGKKISELEADGYEQSSFNEDEEGIAYLEYMNESYTLKVYVEGGIDDLFSLPEDLGTLTIEKIGFLDFSDLFMHE